MLPMKPERPPRDGRGRSLLRRIDQSLGQLNPLLAAVAMGLIVLDLTCVAALLLPTSHLTACVAAPQAPDANPAR